MMKQKFMLFECLMAVSFSVQALLPNIFTPLVSLLIFSLITAVKHKCEGFRSTYVFFLMIQASLMIFSYSIIRVSVALFAYAVLAYFPLYDFPNTKGPFMVGYKNLSLPQNLNVSVFYPTVQKTKKAPYKIEKETWIRMSDFLRSIPGNIIPEIAFRILFSFIDHVDIGANLDAQIISPQLLTYNQKFPVIVFSPGTAGNRNFYTGFARQWASFGYIVFSIDHDEPCRLQFNSVEELKQIRIPHLQERCRLIRSMTDFVYDLQELKNFFQDRDLEIDYDRVSLAGHSFGGAAAAEVALDSRITGALILLDPWFFPSRSEVVETPANRPVLVVRTEGFANFIPEFKVLETIQTYVQSNKQYQDQTLCCYFKNATHKSFTDMIIHMPREMKMIGTVKDFNDIEEIYDSQTMVTQMFLDTMLYAPTYEAVSKKNMMIEAFESYLVSNGAKSQLQVDDF